MVVDMVDEVGKMAEFESGYFVFLNSWDHKH